MFVNKSEEDFFLMSIKNTDRVLEYGSGESTIQIAKKCKSILSIEHQKKWYDLNINNLPKNCELLLREPDLPYVEGGHDGTYDEFKSYVECPINGGPFDIIFIDGRARVSCGSICEKMSHSNTIIFIHDFNRNEYQEVLNYLELTDQVGTMAKFKLKK